MGRLRFGRLDAAAAAAFLAYSASTMVTPVCLVTLSRELDFSLQAGGGIEVARALLILLVLLTSGFTAGRWGKVRVLGVSLALLGGGLGLYAIAPNYALVLLAAGAMGLGSGAIEGLINPLVQDLHPDDSGRYLNTINAFWSIGVLVTVLVTGELLTQNVPWRLIAAGLGGYSLLTGLAFWLLAGRDGPRRHSAADVLGHKWQILRSGRFWLFVPMMFLAGGVEGGFTFWSASYIQIHHGGLPRAAGIGTACFAAGMIAGRLASGWWVAQRHLRGLILASALAGIAVSLWVPAVGALATLYGVLALAGLTVACFWPSIQAYAADRLPVESTSLFILLSCAGMPGFAFTSWLMGWIGDGWGLQASFRVLPLLFALLAALTAVEWAWRPRATPGGVAPPAGRLEQGEPRPR